MTESSGPTPPPTLLIVWHLQTGRVVLECLFHNRLTPCRIALRCQQRLDTRQFLRIELGRRRAGRSVASAFTPWNWLLRKSRATSDRKVVGKPFLLIGLQKPFRAAIGVGDSRKGRLPLFQGPVFRLGNLCGGFSPNWACCCRPKVLHDDHAHLGSASWLNSSCDSPRSLPELEGARACSAASRIS